jgi:hypothetical protein
LVLAGAADPVQRVPPPPATSEIDVELEAATIMRNSGQEQRTAARPDPNDGLMTSFLTVLKAMGFVDAAGGI